MKGMFPKIVGFPPKSSHFNRVFHYKPIHFGGNTPIFGNTQRLHAACHWQPTPTASHQLAAQPDFHQLAAQTCQLRNELPPDLVNSGSPS